MQQPSLDLNMGYYHIELTPFSKRLCTIIMPWGKYKYQQLLMGPCNSPDIFQECIAENLKKNDNDSNLLDLGRYAKCIHIPTLDESIAPEVLIQPDYIAPKVSLWLPDFKTFSTTGISIHDLFFGQCGDAVLVPHQSMGSKALLGCFAISCLGWTSNHTNVKFLPFDHGPSESPTAFASSLECLPFDHGPN